MIDVRYFRSAGEFRRCLQTHHATIRELWVGFYRKDSGKGGITYQEAVDEALCFGWIDGVRKKVDEASYTNRFSPRTPRSIWSAVNIRRAEALKAQGRLAPPGAVAFESRDPKRSGLYSFEHRPKSLPPAYRRAFQAHAQAWKYFSAQPPSYRRVATWWVISAAKEETRQRRLAKLIAESASNHRLGEVTGKPQRER